MKIVSGRRFCQALERAGWNLERVRGSHHTYVKDGSNVVVTVPVHANRDLKIGLLRHLLKLSGLDERDL